MFNFSALDLKYPFWENLVQKIKIVCLNLYLLSRPFKYAEFDIDVHFFWTGNTLFGEI